MCGLESKQQEFKLLLPLNDEGQEGEKMKMECLKEMNATY